MKKAFREYHDLTTAERSKLWKESLIIFDTNVFLDFYSYGTETLDDYFNVLKEAKKRNQLWLPHRVGFEFFERRVGIISRQQNVYDSILKYIEGPSEKISNLTNSSGVHAHLDYKKISSKYESSVKRLVGEIEKLKKEHPDHLGSDSILEQLEKVYINSLVGEPYTKEQIAELVKEGEDRYAKHIPPGFRDENKSEDENKPDTNRKYGDLIIWKQIIDKAKASKKSVIFVTNDAKDDWIQYAKDKRRLGPKPALRKEMLDEAGVDFDLYSADEFLKAAHEQLGVTLRTGSVEEVEKYRKLENERQVEVSSNFVGSSAGYGYARPAIGHKSLLYKLEKALKLCSDIEGNSLFKLTHASELIDIVSHQSDIYAKMRHDLRHGRLRIYSNFDEYENLLSRFEFKLRNIADQSSLPIQRLMEVNESILYSLKESRYKYMHHPWSLEESD
jgi:hypothetical protein